MNNKGRRDSGMMLSLASGKLLPKKMNQLEKWVRRCSLKIAVRCC